MSKHTNTDPLDKALDWNMHMLLREAIVQNVSENKNIHITQEMIDEAKSAAKQAINNYINSRVQQKVANELKYVFVTSKKELYWQSQTSLAKPLKERIAELNQVKGE